MTDLIGQTIGGYQLVELIHQGENTVYKGFQASMNRYVAVKILNPSLAANPDFVQTFQQDLERIAGLEHPNILPIYDYGQQGEVFYIVSRYVETGALKNRLPPAFSPKQAEAMLNPIAEALDYAYRSGVGHGNVKPSNILIDAQGGPLLTDLGYVQGMDVGRQESAYLSPEQAQGMGPDARSDVYALGVLLYHMLVGEPPPPGAAVSPRARRPDLPEEVEKVVLKSTAQAPEQRYQSPSQVAYAFNQALTPQATPAAHAAPEPLPQAEPQAPPPAPAPRRGGFSWAFLLLGVVAICCLLGVLGVVLVGRDREVATPTPPADVEQPAPEPPAPPEGSLLQGFFDMIKGIFDSLASIIDSILGGGTTPPEPPEEQPPGEEQPPPEEPPAEEPGEGPPAEEPGDAPAG
jgi:serine/threonine protein kinase